MASPILSSPQAHPSDEQWMSAPETQPLLDQDHKPEPDNTTLTVGVDPAPAPRGIAPIQLSPDQNLSEDYPFNDHVAAPTTLQRLHAGWGVPEPLSTLSRENKSVFSDIGRGCLIVLSTPFAFIGMSLYALGVIIEGIALVLKGVGTLGGKLLMKRRRGSESPPARPEDWA